MIFQSKGIVQIPDHFILQRWTKDANKGIEFSDTKCCFDTYYDTSKILRRVHSQQEASPFVDLAEESEDLYKLIILEFDNLRVCRL